MFIKDNKKIIFMISFRFAINYNLKATLSSTPKLKFIYDNNDKLYFYLFI